ncbi:hypothetical protein VP01_749g3 [Puccinia sorghi]|uniref:Uncharacterized protein n=1 Tax=Puccinia sorghi TaxID=27349 RepID=A0A0L6UC70_9BASI|nr:hypothetical protein VP01_749g3 [Puccinia sorghi]
MKHTNIQNTQKPQILELGPPKFDLVCSFNPLWDLPGVSPTRGLSSASTPLHILQLEIYHLSHKIWLTIKYFKHPQIITVQSPQDWPTHHQLLPVPLFVHPLLAVCPQPAPTPPQPPSPLSHLLFPTCPPIRFLPPNPFRPSPHCLSAVGPSPPPTYFLPSTLTPHRNIDQIRNVSHPLTQPQPLSLPLPHSHLQSHGAGQTPTLQCDLSLLSARLASMLSPTPRASPPMPAKWCLQSCLLRITQQPGLGRTDKIFKGEPVVFNEFLHDFRSSLQTLSMCRGGLVTSARLELCRPTSRTLTSTPAPWVGLIPRSLASNSTASRRTSSLLW